MNARAVWPILLSASTCFGQVNEDKAAKDARPQAPAASTVVSDDAGVLTSRPVWPLNVPLYVTVNRARFINDKPHEMTLHAVLPSAETINDYVYQSGTCVLPSRDMTWDDQKRLAGTPMSPADCVEFSLKVTDPDGKDPKAAAAPTGPIKLPVKIKGTVDDVLTATPLPDLDAALPKQLNAQFYRRGWNSRGSPRLWLGTYTNCEGSPTTKYPGICHVLTKHPDVTFAVRIEILHAGKAVASTSAWWRGNAKYRTVEPFEGTLAPEILDKTIDQLDAKDGKWSLHLVSAPEMALRDFESVRYWKGDVTLPVKVTDSQDWSELKAKGEEK